MGSCLLALQFDRTQIQAEDTFQHYNYLEEVLNYICSLLPNDVKGEILEEWYKVSLKEVWRPCKRSYCNVLLVVSFGKFIGKSLL